MFAYHSHELMKTIYIKKNVSFDLIEHNMDFTHEFKTNSSKDMFQSFIALESITIPCLPHSNLLVWETFLM